MSTVENPILNTLNSFVFDMSPQDIPYQTKRNAALLFLDTLGICAAAAPMDAGRIGRETAFSLFGTHDPAMGSRMLFDGRTVSLAGSIFAAATQIDNLDGHDGYNPTKGHIGVVAMPALAVLAQSLPELSGPEALCNLIIGYEVAGRAGIALHATVSDYHTSGAWNSLGVVAMAARLRQQTPGQLRQALGMAEYHGPRSQMMREIATPTMLHDGSGWGALTGMAAAISAEQGFTGAPAITVEAEEAEPFWQDLGEFWQVDHQYIKPYPVCRWAHASIDAVKDLRQKHTFANSDIAAIRINSFNNAVELFGGMPGTTSEAQYSLPFSVATLLVHGRIALEHISGTGLSDTGVRTLVEKTTMHATAKHETRYPIGRWADVDIELSNGQILRSGDTHARGGPERPFNEAEIIEKFMEFGSPVLGDKRAVLLRDAVLNLVEESSVFSDVSAHLYDPL